MVVHQLPKLAMGVRFPSLAPLHMYKKPLRDNLGGFLFLGVVERVRGIEVSQRGFNEWSRELASGDNYRVGEWPTEGE